MSRCIFALLILVDFCFASVSSALPGVPNRSLADVVEPLVPAVVNISTIRHSNVERRSKSYGSGEEIFEWFEKFMRPFGEGGSHDEPNSRVESMGSGFFVTESGYIVTNNHVIDKADEIKVNIGGKNFLKARVIGRDQVTDLAVLKVDHKTSLPFVKFGDSNALRVGDPVVVIGNPFGLGGTVTFGIVSSKARDMEIGPNIMGGFIQTDAAINKGNSGGPMFNMQGEVVGVNFAIFAPTGVNTGIGFAIPSSYAKNVVEQLIKKGKVERGALGIVIEEISEELAEGVGDKNLAGVLVCKVIPGGAGFKAGLKAGDVIVKFNDKDVTQSRQLRALVSEAQINSTAKIVVLRNGVKKEFVAKITEPIVLNKEALQTQKLDLKQGSIEHNGVVFSNINQDLRAEIAPQDDAGGIMVRRVDMQSKWKMLRKGDILTSVVGVAKIENVAHWKRIYAQAKFQGRKYLLLLVRRDENMASVKLPVL